MLAHFLLFLSIWTSLSAAAEDIETTDMSMFDVNCLLQTSLKPGRVLQARRSVQNQLSRDQHKEQGVGVHEQSVALYEPNAAMHAATVNSSSTVIVNSSSTFIERPNAGSGPDLVNFGIYVKGVSDLDMTKSTFTTDTVMTVQWHDSRALSLLPSGRDSMTLSKEEFDGTIWLPKVEVTNRIVNGYEIISTAVTVNSSGIVSKVERTISIVKNAYLLDTFPWDTQVLELNIASTTFMSDEVKLIPIADPVISGVKPGLEKGFGGFELLSHEMSEAEMVDGPLRKSRGIFQMTVHRLSSRYLYEHLVPSILLLVMTWAGVFALPLEPAFAMPRLAVSVIGFLSLATLNLRMDSMLPNGAPVTWNNIFDQNLQTLFFFMLCFNIFAELVMHRLKQEELAKHIQVECGLLLLVVSTVTIIFFLCHRGITGLWLLSLTLQIVVVAILGGYILWRSLHASRLFWFEK